MSMNSDKHKPGSSLSLHTFLVVLSLGMLRVHPLVAIVLNLIAVGGLAPTLWGWRRIPVRRWFVLGAGIGVAGGWITLVAMAAAQ